MGNSSNQCEFCDVEFDHTPVMGGRKGLSTYCSEDCKLEADDEIRFWDTVDAEVRVTGEYGPPDSDPYDLDRDDPGF